MSEFETNCPHCNATLNVQDEWIGMNVECPLCKKHFVIERISNPVSNLNNSATKNGSRKRKWYILCTGIISAIAVVAIVIACFCSNSNETESISDTKPAEAVAVQKPRYAGIHFSFKWGYLIDDLDQTEFKSLEQIADHGYTLLYNAMTKNNFAYSIIVEKSSRKIQTISSEDSSTIDSFMADHQSILNSKAMENDKAVCYHSGGIFLIVNKHNTSQKCLVIKKDIWPSEIEKYFNAILKVWQI